MDYFVYYKNGEELISFYNWVLENGTDADKEIHDNNEGDLSSAGFDDLLHKYLKETGATHVRQFNSANEPISDLQEISI